jgi:hypothetical protein
MITPEKLKRLHTIIDKMSDDDKKTEIIKILLTHVDDLFEEVSWLKEQNEELRFSLNDKKFEVRESPYRNPIHFIDPPF